MRPGSRCSECPDPGVPWSPEVRHSAAYDGEKLGGYEHLEPGLTAPICYQNGYANRSSRW